MTLEKKIENKNRAKQFMETVKSITGGSYTDKCIMRVPIPSGWKREIPAVAGMGSCQCGDSSLVVVTDPGGNVRAVQDNWKTIVEPEVGRVMYFSYMGYFKVAGRGKDAVHEVDRDGNKV